MTDEIQTIELDTEIAAQIYTHLRNLPDYDRSDLNENGKRSLDRCIETIAEELERVD